MSANALVVLALMLAAAFHAGVAVAQEDDDQPEQITEEITVVGQKTLLNLKFAAQRAEEDFFNRFNELNTVDEFDVFCDKEASVGSRIKRRRCWSPFEREYDEEQAQQAFLTGSRVGARNEGLIRLKRKKQAEHLKNMVLENPELLALYEQYGLANTRFATERERRCADNILCREPKATEPLPDVPESAE